jgi:hypothetical protein
MTTYNAEALLAKVEAADGPDREIDARLWCWSTDRDFIEIADGSRVYGSYCLPHEHGAVSASRVHKGSLVFRNRSPQECGNQTQCWGTWPPAQYAYTASLDAALSLVERTAPTWTVDLTIYRTNGGEFAPKSTARLFCPYGEIMEHRGEGKTPALALLAALLRALAASSRGSEIANAEAQPSPGLTSNPSNPNPPRSE